MRNRTEPEEKAKEEVLRRARQRSRKSIRDLHWA
jgi:hypothetical protein